MRRLHLPRVLFRICSCPILRSKSHHYLQHLDIYYEVNMAAKFYLKFYRLFCEYYEYVLQITSYRTSASLFSEELVQ